MTMHWRQVDCRDHAKGKAALRMTVVGTQDHRDRLRTFLERNAVRNAILGLIIFNAIALGFSTSDRVMAEFGPELLLLDQAVLSVFVLELALKLYAYGLRFFRDPWNMFDVVVVGVGLLPATESLSALRALRVIRALRILSVVPQMRAVVQALFDALPGFGAVIIMLSVVYYVFAVMATILYGDSFPDLFGTLGLSMYSLFQIMTLEGWSGEIVRPVMEIHPYAWAFFIPFIVMTAFSVLNLFIGLLVNTMQSAVESEAEKEFGDLQALVRAETSQIGQHLQALQAEVRALREDLRSVKGESDG